MHPFLHVVMTVFWQMPSHACAITPLLMKRASCWKKILSATSSLQGSSQLCSRITRKPFLTVKSSPNAWTSLLIVWITSSLPIMKTGNTFLPEKKDGFYGN